MERMKQHYETVVVKKLQEQFSYTNKLMIPRIQKVVVNMGVGEATQNIKAIDAAVSDMTKITGQKPAVKKSKKAIANFKLRAGLPIGVCVTLRNERMYEFLDRFINIALPRVRDFRGIPRNSFDGRGNYSVGFSEQIMFPEIDIEKTTVRGLSITIVTSATTDKEAEALLEFMGMPFRKRSERQLNKPKATANPVSTEQQAAA